jgi:hypothetical protein
LTLANPEAALRCRGTLLVGDAFFEMSHFSNASIAEGDLVGAETAFLAGGEAVVV